MLRAESGRAFDPRIVDIFLARWSDFVALRDEVTRRSLTFADLVRGPIELALP